VTAGNGNHAVSETTGGMADRIERLLEPTLTQLGYAIVRVTMSGRHRPVLQVMAERTDAVAMSVDDCATISRAVSAILDVEDPIPQSYTLEVSSPGIDRPLTRRRDFERFAGLEARLETRELIDGRRRFRGRLLGITNDNAVVIREESGEVTLPHRQILRARLVITDELLKAGADGRRH
jgi:ribosome maturation factor RimP